MRAGATELDMVINLGALKEGNDQVVRDDIAAVVEAGRSAGTDLLVKVIIEVGYLSPAEVERACQLAVEARAHFVKTSTGFGPGGASVDIVQKMRAVVGGQIGIKASGGIRDLATARALLAAGADRLGMSASVAVMQAAEGRD